MTYQLGVDLGTTFSAAAVCRDGRASVVGLGIRSASIPSALLARPDGDFLAGDAALRRGLAEPDRLAREFKRRLGDPTPLVLGGTPWSAQALTARLLRAVVEAVTTVEGAPPERVAVTHPATWGPYLLELFGQAVAAADVGTTLSITEPEAAAVHHASTERVEVGSLTAVYDLGGGTFDAAVLRKTAAGFDTLGRPEGIERLGGVDFDEAVFAHVRRSLGDALDGLDPADPATRTAVAHLREECVAAKEALSADTETTITVLLPGVQRTVRLTRGEFEAMIRPALADTVATMDRVLREAGVDPGDLDRFLLVGGSSRIPLVAQVVAAEWGRPVAVDVHPKHAVALGAALAAARSGAATRPTPPPPTPVPVATPDAPSPVPGPPPVPDPGPDPLPAPHAGPSTRPPARPPVAVPAVVLPGDPAPRPPEPRPAGPRAFPPAPPGDAAGPGPVPTGFTAVPPPSPWSAGTATPGAATAAVAGGAAAASVARTRATPAARTAAGPTRPAAHPERVLLAVVVALLVALAVLGAIWAATRGATPAG